MDCTNSSKKSQGFDDGWVGAAVGLYVCGKMGMGFWIYTILFNNALEIECGISALFAFLVSPGGNLHLPYL